MVVFSTNLRLPVQTRLKLKMHERKFGPNVTHNEHFYYTNIVNAALSVCVRLKYIKYLKTLNCSHLKQSYTFLSFLYFEYQYDKTFIQYIINYVEITYLVRISHLGE